MSIDYADETEYRPEPLVTSTLTREDEGEFTLRPQRLNEYIGQEKAKRSLCVAVYNHYKRISAGKRAEGIELQKSNVLMVGPTGCGKTYLSRSVLPPVPPLKSPGIWRHCSPTWGKTTSCLSMRSTG